MKPGGQGVLYENCVKLATENTAQIFNTQYL